MQSVGNSVLYLITLETPEDKCKNLDKSLMRWKYFRIFLFFEKVVFQVFSVFQRNQGTPSCFLQHQFYQGIQIFGKTIVEIKQFEDSCITD